MSKISDYIKTSFFILLFIQIAPKMIQSIKENWMHKLESHNKIGYIYINGNITRASHYQKQLTSYFKNPLIKAILLKIESHGGAAGSCQALAYDIINLKKEYPKPIITYSENMCTCGAYQIAAATDHIVTTGSCIIGNIGINTTTSIDESMTKEESNHPFEIAPHTTNHNSISTEKVMLFELSKNNATQLTKEVASQRHLQLHKIDQWGQAKLFTGLQAYDLKLVDTIGSKSTAINLLKKNIIPSDRKIEWITADNNSYIEFFWTQYNDEDDDLDTYTTQKSQNLIDIKSFLSALYK